MEKIGKILAFSGSVRAQSTNSFFLEFLSEYAPNNLKIEIYDSVKSLPIFDIDDIENPSQIIKQLLDKIRDCDAILISCPEYIHSIPGGIKNLIDWLVPNEEIIDKHIFLVHASHRGEDLLEQLRLVLRTVSNNFHEDIFIRFGLMNKNRDEIFEILKQNRTEINSFFDKVFERIS